MIKLSKRDKKETFPQLESYHVQDRLLSLPMTAFIITANQKVKIESSTLCSNEA